MANSKWEQETPMGYEVHLVGVQMVMGQISHNNHGWGTHTCVKRYEDKGMLLGHPSIMRGFNICIWL